MKIGVICRIGFMIKEMSESNFEGATVPSPPPGTWPLAHEICHPAHVAPSETDIKSISRRVGCYRTYPDDPSLALFFCDPRHGRVRFYGSALRDRL
jgi:hypothetical protein